MIAVQTRSGLVETFHDGAVAVVGPEGQLLASHGDVDKPFFIRSSAKPFQAAASQAAGADLSPLQMAMACASHRGFPVHAALVDRMLSEVGLSETDLSCPPAYPLAPAAARVADRTSDDPRRLWHNCSGKHAGFLRACVAAGWPTDSYLDPDHPLQQSVIALMSELSPVEVAPLGVDGCGAPVFRTTTRALAALYSSLSTDDRLVSQYQAMRRYPALVGANGEGDTSIATTLGVAAKGGAAGCIGVALDGGVGVAAKSWDGLGVIANLAAASALQQLDRLTEAMTTALEPVLRPPVLGGGEVVGSYEARFEL